jgi:hypothetical protein
MNVDENQLRAPHHLSRIKHSALRRACELSQGIPNANCKHFFARSQAVSATDIETSLRQTYGSEIAINEAVGWGRPLFG